LARCSGCAACQRYAASAIAAPTTTPRFGWQGTIGTADRTEKVATIVSQEAISMHSSLRARFVCVVVALIAVIAGGSAQAQSFGVDLRNTLMPASGGMAGTSIAAPQDLVSAVNANAAALTQYHGTQFTLGGAFVGSTFNLEQTVAAPAIGVDPFSAKSA